MDLKTERVRLDKSQIEMAAGIGVSINTYVNWERGVMNPNEENEAKIIAFLMREDDKRRG